MNAKSFNITVQGASHIRQNKVCQDYSMSTPAILSAGEKLFAVVCDGHGGSDYMRSNIGSKLAAQAAAERIYTFLDEATPEMMERDYRRQLRYLYETILNDWHNRVRRHLSEHPFTINELKKVSDKARRRYTNKEQEQFFSAYGTTLIAVGYTEEFWFGLHIGDGKCVAVDKSGAFSQPIPWDERCFLNATTSICDKDAVNRFRYFYSKELPAAVFVASDGIDDCFANDEKMYNLYRTMVYSMAKDGFDETVDEFRNYLPRMSANGSGDDMSVAAIVDMDAIAQFTTLEEKVNEQKKAVKEQKRVQKKRARAAAVRTTVPIATGFAVRQYVIE